MKLKKNSRKKKKSWETSNTQRARVQADFLLVLGQVEKKSKKGKSCVSALPPTVKFASGARRVFLSLCLVVGSQIFCQSIRSLASSRDPPTPSLTSSFSLLILIIVVRHPSYWCVPSATPQASYCSRSASKHILTDTLSLSLARIHNHTNHNNNTHHLRLHLFVDSPFRLLPPFQITMASLSRNLLRTAGKAKSLVRILSPSTPQPD